jgi:hypothetical protein
MRVVQCFVKVFWAHCLIRKGTLFGRVSIVGSLGLFRFSGTVFG